eukprot:snap_masked-scaffold_2-processed-gene-6.29-mRNA-1 protein AED:1.00 eAED:1.00 QI:0/-1/0/0/-1/1/1/0/277
MKCFTPKQERNKVKVLSFDLDDTLWNLEPVYRRANQAQIDFWRGNYPDFHSQFSSKTWWKIYRRLEKEFPKQKHNYIKMRKLTYRAHALKVYTNLTEAQLDTFVTQSFNAFNTVRQQVEEELFPGVVSTLQKLKSMGFILCTLTNGTGNIEETEKLRKLFDYNFSAASAGALKPSRKVFKHLMKKTGCKPGEVIHFGDDFRQDVLGSLDSGMGAAWMCLAFKFTEEKEGQTLAYHGLDHNKNFKGVITEFSQILDIFRSEGVSVQKEDGKRISVISI